MGNNQSSKVTNMVDIFESTVNSILIERIQETSNVVYQENEITFINKGTINCSVSTYQQNDSDLKTAAVLQSMTTADMSNVLDKAVTQIAENKSTNTSEFLQLTFNNQDSETNNISRFRNELQNIFKDSIKQTCSNFSKQGNKIIWTNEGTINCPVGENLKIDQKNIVRSVSECLTSAIVDVLMKNYSKTDVDQEGKNILDLTVKGIVDIVNSFFDMFKNIAVAIAVVAGIGFLVFIFFLLKGGNNQNKQNKQSAGIESEYINLENSMDTFNNLKNNLKK